MSENNYKRLLMIKKRKEARNKQRAARISLLAAIFVIIIIVFFLLIKGIVSLFTGPGTVSTEVPVNDIGASAIPTPNVAAESISYSSLPHAAEENDILLTINNSASDKKVCYLTFDDGPNNSVTPLILDILRKYNIKATFFQVGSMIEENMDMAKRVHEEGHLIGGHSYSHVYSKLYESPELFMDDISKCNNLIKEVTGDDYFPLIRFPGGSHNSGTYGEKKQEYKKLLSENGIYHCDWNALNGDAESNTKTAAQLITRLKDTAKGKNQVVVLMHDTITKKSTVEALPKIIEYFIENGYVFSTLDKPIFN